MAGEFDEEVLDTAVDRKDVLAALAADPHHRREIEEQFGISKTTCHRIIRSFDEHGFIRRTEHGYEATLLGRIVADQVTRFEDVVETAYQLEPLLELVEASDVEFDHRLFTAGTDWTIERSRTSIDRGVERVRSADVLRVLDWTPVPDLYIERILQIMIENGTRGELVYPRSVVQARLETFPDLYEELVETTAGHRYWVYEDVPPWGMTIYDDALVELRAYEQETGALLLEATSTDESVVQWGREVFTAYRDRADPVTEVEGLPDWGDYSW